MTSSRRLTIAACLLGMLALAGCQALHSDIDVVRDGVLADYNTTTVGKAFEGTFQTAKWTSFVTPKGATVVEFNGTIRADVLLKHEFLSILDEKGFIEQCNASQADKIASQMKDAADHVKAREIEKRAATDNVTWQSDPAVREKEAADIQALHAKWDPIYAADEEAKKQTAALISKCVDEKMSAWAVPVKVQFLMSTDKKTFTINYIDEKAFAGHQDKVLAFVYR